MAKKKISSKTVIGGVIALGLIGSVLPNDTPDDPPEETPVVREEVVDAVKPGGTAIEELLQEEPDLPDEPVGSPELEPVKESKASGLASQPEPNKPQTPSESAPVKQEEKPIAPVELVKSEEPPAVDPEQAFREKLAQYKYVGSSESDRYHYPSCRWTSAINDGNLVHFDSEEEAVAAGYSPCGTCNP